MSGAGGDYLRSKLENMQSEYINPTTHISNWVTGEVLALTAFNECVAELANTDVLKKRAESAVQVLNSEVEKLNAGKFHFGSMFQSENDRRATAEQKA